MDWIIWWFIGVVVLGVALYFIEEHKKKNHCIDSCNKYNFYPTHTYGNFLVDINSSRWMVSYPTGTSKVYHISETTYWELNENNRRVDVNICVCDPNTPLVVVPCLITQHGKKVRTDSLRYSLAKDDASKIIAVLDSMNDRYIR